MDEQQSEIVNPFTDVPYIPFASPIVQDKQFLSDVAELQVGAGSSKVLRGNKEGFWLGAKGFSSAPFRVDMQGNVVASSITVSGYVAEGGAAADINGNPTTVSGGKITANSITADRLTVSSLSAISADLGTITAGAISGVTIAIGSANSIFKADSNGIYLGNATFASAPFKVSMVGAVNASNLTVTGGSINLGSGVFQVDASGNVTANSYSLNSGNILNVANGMGFKNNIGLNFYETGNATLSGQLVMDTSNRMILYHNNGEVWVDSNNNVVKLVSGANTCLTANTDGSVSIATLNLTNAFGADLHIASTKNLIFDGTQGSINCGSIDCNSIEMNSQSLNHCQAIVFSNRDTSWTPGNSEFGNEDNATNQRLRMKFTNNGTQWQVSLSAVCTPVNKKDYAPEYFDKYELMEELDESRFKLKYPKSNDVQKEYRGRPVSHFPSMGDPDNTAWQKHMEAMWKRPWLPIKKMPHRMETMGQYPYPPVHSSLIGEGESMANMYQLLAHAYNTLQERYDNLENQIRSLQNG